MEGQTDKTLVTSKSHQIFGDLSIPKVLDKKLLQSCLRSRLCDTIRIMKIQSYLLTFVDFEIRFIKSKIKMIVQIKVADTLSQGYIDADPIKLQEAVLRDYMQKESTNCVFLLKDNIKPEDALEVKINDNAYDAESQVVNHGKNLIKTWLNNNGKILITDKDVYLFDSKDSQYEMALVSRSNFVLKHDDF